MYLYSIESFLYKRINEVVRNRVTKDKDDEIDKPIENLGPYAVLISKVINQRTRTLTDSNRIQGKFVVYRGIQLPANVVEEWKRRDTIVLEGYSSCSQILSVAIRFAHFQESNN